MAKLSFGNGSTLPTSQHAYVEYVVRLPILNRILFMRHIIPQ